MTLHKRNEGNRIVIIVDGLWLCLFVTLSNLFAPTYVQSDLQINQKNKIHKISLKNIKKGNNYPYTFHKYIREENTRIWFFRWQLNLNSSSSLHHRHPSLMCFVTLCVHSRSIVELNKKLLWKIKVLHLNVYSKDLCFNELCNKSKNRSKICI